MNWGIISASRIANRFIEALQREKESVYAIASRNIERANEFKQKYSISKAYGSYDELLNDEEVDIVYISSINSCHYDLVVKAIEAGKHIICEKPLSVKAADAADMVARAGVKKVFFMEALWSRFLPIYKEIHKVIEDGEIGEVMQVRADFSFVAERNEDWRLLNSEMGGGALYDIGIYSVMFILDFLKLDLKNIKATGFIGNTGVDEDSVVSLNFGNGKSAVMWNSFISQRRRMGTIIGTKGQINVPDFYSADTCEVVFFKDRKKMEIEMKCEHENKFVYEIEEAVNCISRGRKESDKMPLSHSLKAAEIIDEAIRQLREEVV